MQSHVTASGRGSEASETRYEQLTKTSEVAAKAKLTITSRQIKKVEGVIEVRRRREEHNQELGFTAQPFILCSLPVRRPPNNTTEYVRNNGRFTLTIVAPSKLGIPWGSYDRLLVLWLATTAVRTKTRLVRFRSVKEIMDVFGLKTAGKQYQRMREAIDRVFGARFYIEERLAEGHTMTVRREAFSFVRATESVQVSNRRGRRSLALDADMNTIMLTEEFYQLLERHPIPVDLSVIRNLTDAPGAMDFYCWLVFRSAVARQVSRIPLTGLHGLERQMGVSDKLEPRWFRRQIRKWLRVVRAHWRECPASLSDDGQHLIVGPGRAIHSRPVNR